MNISSLKKKELENLDDSINSKIKDSSYAPIDLTAVDTNKKSLNESLSNNKHPINNPALSKITDNIQKLMLKKHSPIAPKDSSDGVAPIDLTTIDNSKHPITIENPKLSKALSTITGNIQEIMLAKEKARQEKLLDDFMSKPKKPKI